MIDTNGNLVVVDVREENEYCDAGATPPGHIPGALNYPWTSGVFEDRYDELPDGRPILVVCLTGGRSAQASNFLCTHGFSPVYNMTGGMLEWEWETIGCCSSHEDCDDGLYCNGEEVCVDLNCQPGSPPCEPSYCCDEESHCLDHPGDTDCDGVPDEGGDHPCTTGEITGCDDNCPEHPNGPGYGTCVIPWGTNPLVVSYREGDPKEFIACDSDDDCTFTPDAYCQMEQGDCNDNGCGDVCECYADVSGSSGVPDGSINAWDYGILKLQWGDICPCQADLNEDGGVNAWDYGILKLQWGQNCPACP